MPTGFAPRLERMLSKREGRQGYEAEFWTVVAAKMTLLFSPQSQQMPFLCSHCPPAEPDSDLTSVIAPLKLHWSQTEVNMGDSSLICLSGNHIHSNEFSGAAPQFTGATDWNPNHGRQRAPRGPSDAELVRYEKEEESK